MKKIYFFLCLILIPFSVSAKQYGITNYYVDVIVNENNIYNVTEYYNLLFFEDSEFTRTISLRPKVHLSNGKFISYVTKLANINTNEIVSIKEYSKMYKITFPKYSANTSKAVSIKYDYNMGYDLDNNSDIVFINIVDGSIETATDTSTFSITLPNIIDKTNIKIYKDGKQLIEDSSIEYTVLGNHIEGTINYQINKDDTIGIQIILPEGTFKNMVRTDSSISYLLIIIPIVMLIISIFLAKKYKSKKVEAPFQIEDKYDSVEMSYLYNGKINVTDMLSLLFKLANNGYISFKNYGSKDNISFKIKKEREYDKNNAAQKILFDGLFQNKDEVDIHDIEGVFYPYYMDAQRTLQNKKNKTKLFHKFTNKIKKFLLIGTYIGLMLIQIKPLYNLFDSYVFGIIGSIIISAILTLAHQPKNKNLKYSLLAVSGVLIAVEGYTLLELKLDFLIYIITIMLSEITLVLETFIPIRTDYGIQKYHEVNTFKLELASMSDEKFNAKVKDNHNYFFDMIPYVIVFDLTKWWFKRFGNKVDKAPNWYESSETYTSEKLLEFIEAVMSQLVIPVQTNKSYSDELLNQAPNKLL